jgi:hypothetical protein
VPKNSTEPEIQRSFFMSMVREKIADNKKDRATINTVSRY